MWAIARISVPLHCHVIDNVIADEVIKVTLESLISRAACMMATMSKSSWQREGATIELF